MGKVTGYTELTAGSSDDVLYIVDSGAGATPTGKKAKLETLLKAISSVGVVAAGTSGALFYINSSKEPTWLAVPTSGAVLTWSSVSKIPEWSKPTSGSIMVGSSVGTPTWLAVPSSGAVLTWSSADAAVAWYKPTSGAVMIGSSLGTPTWLGIGTSGYVLQCTGGAPAWVQQSGGSTAINLPAAAWQPTGNGSSHASAQLAVVQSAGSLPSPRWQEWLFDPTTAEHIVTTFRVPPNYTGASAATLTVQYYSTAAVSSGVSWAVRIGAIPTSGSFTNWAFGTTAAISTFAVPSTAYDLGVAVVNLTEGSSLLAAGSFVCLDLYRNVAGGDSAAGDMHVVGCEFAYS